MRKFVLGFLFDYNARHVVLLEKKRPDWQAEHLNGVGGKVELTDPSILATMIREGFEETGVTPTWHHFGDLRGAGRVVHLFCAYDDTAFSGARSTTDELVTRAKLPLRNPELVRNVAWLVPLAIEYRNGGLFYDISDSSG